MIVAIGVNRLARILIEKNNLTMRLAVVSGATIYGAISIVRALYGEWDTSIVTMGGEGGRWIEDTQTTRAGYIQFFVFQPFVQAVIGAVAALTGWLAAFGTIKRVDIIPG